MCLPPLPLTRTPGWGLYLAPLERIEAKLLPDYLFIKGCTSSLRTRSALSRHAAGKGKKMIENARDVCRDRDRYVAFSIAAADAFFELSSKGNVCFSSGATQWFAEASPEAIDGRSILDIVVPEDHRLLNAVLSQARHQGRSSATFIRFIGRAGNTRRASVHGVSLPQYGNTVFLTAKAVRPHIVSNSIPASDVDLDTGLLTPGGFSKTAQNILEANRDGGAQLTMSLLHLGGLGDIRQGLDEEENMDLASHISSVVRAFSLDGLCASQLAEEKFGVLHEGRLDADAIKKGIREHVKAKNIDVNASGLALRSKNLAQNDMARALVYSINEFANSKSDFKIGSLNESYDEMLGDTKQKLEKFRATITGNEYDIVLQPIVNLESNKTHHYEALTRLHDVSQGESPFRFITFAEQLGVIGDFDLAVCRRVINLLKNSNELSGELSIAVNISGRSLQSDGFVDALVEILVSCSSIRKNLMFELTESAEIKDLEATNRVLQKIRKMGHSVCLDDFGAGASGFQYLKALEADYVKIDGMYIRDALGSRNGRAFLKSMAKLCSDLGIKTVGECVEDVAQANFLKEIGVDYGQGYFFGRPAERISGSCMAFDSRDEDAQTEDVHALLARGI